MYRYVSLLAWNVRGFAVITVNHDVRTVPPCSYRFVRKSLRQNSSPLPTIKVVDLCSPSHADVEIIHTSYTAGQEILKDATGLVLIDGQTLF